MSGGLPWWMPDHALMTVTGEGGRRLTVTPCMLRRLDEDEIVRGRVATDMPEYDVPGGYGCHPDWRGGCDVDESDGDGGGDDA